MKKILCIAFFLFSLSALANDPHKAALNGEWGQMFRDLRAKKFGLNTVKDGITLLDIALKGSPLDVRTTLLQMEASPSALLATIDDEDDLQELTKDQLQLIDKWINENELDSIELEAPLTVNMDVPAAVNEGRPKEGARRALDFSGSH